MPPGQDPAGADSVEPSGEPDAWKLARPVRGWAGGQFPGPHHHLGAAWVLISEHQNGYPHRLLAIGHLHEAEEESQAWPELHTAIREARKAYQQTGKTPEFTALAAQITSLPPTSGA